MDGWADVVSFNETRELFGPIVDLMSPEDIRALFCNQERGRIVNSFEFQAACRSCHGNFSTPMIYVDQDDSPFR